MPGKRAVFLDRDGVVNRAVVRDGKTYKLSLSIPATLGAGTYVPTIAVGQSAAVIGHISFTVV